MSKSRLKTAGPIVCLAAIFLVSACRQDMHDNPRFTAYQDGANRIPPEGTVARGSLALAVAAPKAAVPGQIGSVGEDGFPFKLSSDTATRKKEILEILDRGESRFNITCLPCHGKLGDGNGMVALRGFRHPPNYTDERLLKAPTSHFYDVITNGFGAMPSYAEVVTPDDRWKIIAYIRALQVSQSSKYDELNAADKKEVDASEKSSAPSPTPVSGGHGN
jgi:mono/diheme cytochrome c family protein